MSTKIEAVAEALAAENGQSWSSMSGYKKSKFYGLARSAIEASDLYDMKQRAEANLMVFVMATT